MRRTPRTEKSPEGGARCSWRGTGNRVAGEAGQRREGNGQRRAGAAVRGGKTPEGWNPGRGSRVKQTCKAGSGARRRGRAKRRGRNVSSGPGNLGHSVDAACRCRDEGPNPVGGALRWTGRFDAVQHTKGRSQADRLWRRRKARRRMKPQSQGCGGRRTDDTASTGGNAGGKAGVGNLIVPRSGR